MTCSAAALAYIMHVERPPAAGAEYIAVVSVKANVKIETPKILHISWHIGAYGATARLSM